MARTPGPANDGYGFANWYPQHRAQAGVSDRAGVAPSRFAGNGSNIIYIDWENDLVVVVRWIRQTAFNEFIGQVVGSLPATAR